MGLGRTFVPTEDSLQGTEWLGILAVLDVFSLRYVPLLWSQGNSRDLNSVSGTWVLLTGVLGPRPGEKRAQTRHGKVCGPDEDVREPQEV